MSIVGVTGHRELTPRIRQYVRKELTELLRGRSPLRGLSSLADGADQLFAHTVLREGGRLHAVIPAAGYVNTIREVHLYQRLLAGASETVMLGFDTPGPAAYEAAGRYIVENCDLLVAVWDGAAPRGRGGTFAAVDYARTIGRELVVCWPTGAVRP
jgi:hypothetical protein